MPVTHAPLEPGPRRKRRKSMAAHAKRLTTAADTTLQELGDIPETFRFLHCLINKS